MQVSDFIYVTATEPKLSYPFRVWGRPDRVLTQSQGITNRAAAVQTFFAEYLNQPFPLRKQDQMAVSTHSSTGRRLLPHLTSLV